MALFALVRERARSTASKTPLIFSRADQDCILRRESWPRLAISVGLESALRNSSVRAGTSPQGKMKSGFTGAMRSVVAPTRSLAATGHPQHEASFTTTAKGSYSEGRTIKSAALYTAGNAD